MAMLNLGVPLLRAAPLCLLAGAAGADCTAAKAELQALFQGADMAPMVDKARALADAGCDPGTVRAALRLTASQAARRAHAALEAGDPDKAATILGTAPVLHWEVLAMRGALATRARDHAAAAEAYNRALDTLGAPDLTPQDPALEPAAHRLMMLAQEAMMLAGHAQASMRADGSITGVMKALGDGMTASDNRYNVVRAAAAHRAQVYLPLQFSPGSDRLDPAGQDQVRALAAYLRALPAGLRVHVIGHTDDTGDAAANRDLSLRRAQAVRNHLVARGVGADIVIEGRGEAAPPELLEATAYSIEERRRIARRVEVRLETQ